MGDQSAIEWCDSTFNPWIGCTRVGPGCDHCYAEAMMDTRLGRVEWGAGKARKRTSAANWRKPLTWDGQAFYQCSRCGWRGDDSTMAIADGGGWCPRCMDSDGAVLEPASRRVFCASLADVFDNEVDPAWRADLFELIAATPRLDWLLLTKRIGNAREMMEIASTGARMMGAEWPLPNVWLGATVVNQAEADRDIPKLLAVPARVRFLSIEPMLGEIKLQLRVGHRYADYDGTSDCANGCGCWAGPFRSGGPAGVDPLGACPKGKLGIDWIICGGESGPGARPMHPDWARLLRDQCATAGVPFFMKQMTKKAEIPGDLQVREFPNANS